MLTGIGVPGLIILLILIAIVFFFLFTIINSFKKKNRKTDEMNKKLDQILNETEKKN